MQIDTFFGSPAFASMHYLANNDHDSNDTLWRDLYMYYNKTNKHIIRNEYSHQQAQIWPCRVSDAAQHDLRWRRGGCWRHCRGRSSRHSSWRQRKALRCIPSWCVAYAVTHTNQIASLHRVVAVWPTPFFMSNYVLSARNANFYECLPIVNLLLICQKM